MFWGLRPPSTNRALPCTRWGAYRPPADFPMLALHARGVPKLTSGYATGFKSENVNIENEGAA